MRRVAEDGNAVFPSGHRRVLETLLDTRIGGRAPPGKSSKIISVETIDDPHTEGRCHRSFFDGILIVTWPIWRKLWIASLSSVGPASYGIG